MSTRLVLLALDALEASALTLGDHPTLEGLASNGASGTVTGTHLTLTDTVWPEIRTGVSAATSGVYYQPAQFRTGETRPRALRREELSPERLFWNVAADAGCQVLACDMPLAPPAPNPHLTEIGSWGTHDRPFPTFTTQGIAREAVRTADDYPIWICNPKTRTEQNRLPDLLHRGIDMKTELYADMFESESWDLVAAAFSEAHCVGHHCWPPDDRDEVPNVYRHLDRALGHLLDRFDSETTVIVYTSHGMRPANDGVFLVAEVLEGLGMVSSNRTRRRASALLPEFMRPVIRKIVGGSLLARAGLTFDRSIVGETAIPLPNSHHGAIRLSLAGRDPDGTLEPGSAEHERILSEIGASFESLTLPQGGPAVSDVILVDDLLGTGHNPDLPDIVIRFREDVGLIHECHSPTLGHIVAARQSGRSGEHGTPGAIWAMGPGITPGANLGEIATIDLAPTALSLLGIEPPAWMEGTPIPGIVG